MAESNPSRHSIGGTVVAVLGTAYFLWIMYDAPSTMVPSNKERIFGSAFALMLCSLKLWGHARQKSLPNWLVYPLAAITCASFFVVAYPEIKTVMQYLFGL